MNSFKDSLFRISNNYKGTKFNINGTEIRLDESLRRWNYSSEQGMLDVMKERLKPGDGFIDIGANFGLHSTVAAKLVGSTGKVIAVEPLPKNVWYLKKHSKLNRLEHCEIIQAVISNGSAQEIEFFFPDEQFIQTGGLKPGTSNQHALMVKNIRLDDLDSVKTRPFNMIKIDVEGAEMDVILSGENFIRKYHPDLLIEIHGFALPDFGFSQDELLRKLNEIGYTEKRIDGAESRTDYFQSFFYFK